jgi:hypothetical protein
LSKNYGPNRQYQFFLKIWLKFRFVDEFLKKKLPIQKIEFLLFVLFRRMASSKLKRFYRRPSNLFQMILKLKYWFLEAINKGFAGLPNKKIGFPSKYFFGLVRPPSKSFRNTINLLLDNNNDDWKIHDPDPAFSCQDDHDSSIFWSARPWNFNLCPCFKLMVPVGLRTIVLGSKASLRSKNSISNWFFGYYSDLEVSINKILWLAWSLVGFPNHGLSDQENQLLGGFTNYKPVYTTFWRLPAHI